MPRCFGKFSRRQSRRKNRRRIRRKIRRRHLPEALAPASASPARRMMPVLVATSSGVGVRIPASPGSVSWRRRSLLLRQVAPTPTRTQVVWVRLLSIFIFRPAPSSTSGVRPESPRQQVFVEVAVVSVEFSTHEMLSGVLWPCPSPWSAQ